MRYGSALVIKEVSTWMNSRVAGRPCNQRMLGHDLSAVRSLALSLSALWQGTKSRSIVRST